MLGLSYVPPCLSHLALLVLLLLFETGFLAVALAVLEQVQAGLEPHLPLLSEYCTWATTVIEGSAQYTCGSLALASV